MNRPKRHNLTEPGAHALFVNSLFIAGSQGSVALLFIIYIFAARLLGDTAFGEFSLGLTIATVLFMLPAWGSNRYSSIMAARYPERTEEILAANLGLTALLSVFYFPLVALVARLLAGPSPVVWVALLLGVDLLAREFGNLQRLLFRVHNEYPSETVTAFAERGSIVIAAGLVLALKPTPVALAAAFAGGRTLGTVLTSILFLRKIGRIGVLFDRAGLRQLLVHGTPLALRRGLGLVTFRVDILFLGGMRTSEEVGWYNSIYTFMDGALLLPNAVNGSLGPTLSANHAEGGRDTIARLYRRGFKYLLIIGLFAAALFAIFANPIVTLVYGPGFIEAAPALQILSLAFGLILVRSLTTEVLDNVDLRGPTVGIFASGLSLNVLLNLFLIPQYGYLGAAGSTVATELVLVAGMIWVLHRAGYPLWLLRAVRAPVGASIPMVAALWFLRENPVTACLAGSVVYFLALWILGAWDDKDRAALAGVFRRLTRAPE